MHWLRTLVRSPWLHVVLLELAVASVFIHSRIVPMDDHVHYQRFIETLAQGSIDLSIPGFHGASFLALPLYLLTHSPLANIHFQILCALLLVPAAYLAATAVLRGRFQSILFTYAMALMPFYFFLSLRGFTFPSFTLLVLATLWLRAKGSAWAWLPFSVSLLIKPFSIALAPLFLFWKPGGKKSARWNAGHRQFLFALALPLLYVVAEYLQIGRIIIGAHADIDQTNVFPLWRLPLNAAHGIQMLFSIHNFYFVDPARTSLGNMTHSSPLLMLLGVFSLLYPKEFWKDRRLAGALLLCAAFAFVLAAALDHMDHFYMETCVLLLTLASIPVIARYRLLIPIVLATFHFQFFYLYLTYRDVFFTNYCLFTIPVLVDAMAVAAVLLLVTPSEWKHYGRQAGLISGKD